MRPTVLISIALGFGLWAQPHFLPSAIADNAAQGEAAPTRPANPPGATSNPSREPKESWRRIRGQNSPAAGPKTAAIFHIADFKRSDPDLAGLMLRCVEHGVEAVIVVVEPFPPHARPKITLRAAGQEFYFEGEIIPTGVGIRLPVDGGNLAANAWFHSPELRITISDGASTIEGVVDLAGLQQALNSLIADCARN